MRTRYGIVLGLVVPVLIMGSLAPAPRDDVKDRVAALARQRLDVIREAIKIDSKRRDVGEGSIQAARLWTRRLVEAHRQAGSGKAEYVAALKELVAYETKAEAGVQQMYKSGGATQLELLDAQDGLLEAKIWLENAQSQ